MKNEQLEQEIIDTLEAALLGSDSGGDAIFAIPEIQFEKGSRSALPFPYFGPPMLKEIVLNGIGFASHATKTKAVWVAFDAWFREISKEQADYETKEFGAIRTPTELPLDDRNQAVTILCARFDGSASTIRIKRYRMEKGQRVLIEGVQGCEVVRESCAMLDKILNGFEKGVRDSKDEGA